MTSCFSCTGCGKCCTGAPGYVFLSSDEMEKMASHLGLSLEAFSKKYVRVVGSRFSLKELLPHYDCVFFKDNQCTVYDVRPTQCRTYPFWPMHLTDEESWEEVKKECEGIDPKSRLPILQSSSCHS